MTQAPLNPDWTGNARSVHAALGSRTGAKTARQEHDYYATPPEAVEALLAAETFSDLILEPCCGEGHISEVLWAARKDVASYDLIDRGYSAMTSTADFLSPLTTPIFESWEGDIITNPPYATALEFIQRSLEITFEGAKIAMLLRLQFLEGIKRGKFFKLHPPKTVYVFSKRITCAKNGDFEAHGSGAVAFAWFVWENGYQGDITVKHL